MKATNKEVIKNLLDIISGKLPHKIGDCSQPGSSFPDEFHYDDCEACKIIKEAEKLIE